MTTAQSRLLDKTPQKLLKGEFPNGVPFSIAMAIDDAVKMGREEGILLGQQENQDEIVYLKTALAFFKAKCGVKLEDKPFPIKVTQDVQGWKCGVCSVPVNAPKGCECNKVTQNAK